MHLVPSFYLDKVGALSREILCKLYYNFRS